MNQVLARLRGELVEPCSAGTLEQGAYHRGYTNINKLSMLCEVEKLADKFLFTSERELAASTMGATELLSEISCRLSYFCHNKSYHSTPLLKSFSTFDLILYYISS